MASRAGPQRLRLRAEAAEAKANDYRMLAMAMYDVIHAASMVLAFGNSINAGSAVHKRIVEVLKSFKEIEERCGIPTP